MSSSANLGLPFIAPAQAQKHVTHNEALRRLDALVQLAVLDRNLATPPGAPVEGARYIVAASPTGAWAGKATQIAAWQDGAWTFYMAQEGWLAWVADEDTLLVWDGNSWEPVAAGGGSITELQNLTRLGFGMTADATNPFAAKLNKVLWTARIAADGGDGDLRTTLNKETAADVLSLIFQSGFSARAEAGLIGDDDFLFKVSPDGSTFHEAIRIDKDSGAVAFPNTSLGATIAAPQGRLTLVSGQPVAIADQIARTAIYWTPEGGRFFPRWNGSAFAMVDGGGELTLNLSGNSGHAGYQQADRNFDVFAAVNGSVPVIGAGPSWHAGAVAGSDTARGTGAGSTELERHHGFLVNRNQIVLRIGSASGDTITVPARQALWLGGVRTTANGQVEDSAARRFLFNAYDRRARPMRKFEPTTSWSYTTPTFRQMNANPANRIEFLIGEAGDAIDIQSLHPMTASSTPSAAIGLDSLSAPHADCAFGFGASGGAYGTVTPILKTIPAIGHHYCAPLEKGNTGATFYGSIADTWRAGITGVLMA